MSETALTLEDMRSTVWRKIKSFAESELIGLRANLEADQDTERTAKLRGQIRSFVVLLALETPAPAVEEEEPD